MISRVCSVLKKNLNSLSVRKGRFLPYIFFQVNFHLFYGFATKTTVEFRKFRKIMTGFFPNDTHPSSWKPSLRKLEGTKDPVADGDDVFVMV